jgi:predicted ArsR family transcriptional regulator
LMAEAIVTSIESGEPVSGTLRAAALAAGRRMGQEAGRAAGRRLTSDGLVAAVCEVLEACGYEPRADGDEITLSNCPFASLAADYTSLVCGMNLDLLRGLAGSLADEPLQARLDPAPGRCCVTLTRTRTGGTGGV